MTCYPKVFLSARIPLGTERSLSLRATDHRTTTTIKASGCPLQLSQGLMPALPSPLTCETWELASEPRAIPAVPPPPPPQPCPSKALAGLGSQSSSPSSEPCDPCQAISHQFLHRESLPTYIGSWEESSNKLRAWPWGWCQDNDLVRLIITTNLTTNFNLLPKYKEM